MATKHRRDRPAGRSPKASLVLGETPRRERRIEAAITRSARPLGLRIAKLENELLASEESIRWYENDLESDVPARKKNAETKLAEYRAGARSESPKPSRTAKGGAGKAGRGVSPGQ